jgi:2',3'-cyclic-nucleotide 2'-phosphodiesterase (5'-nucleotidase family)
MTDAYRNCYLDSTCSKPADMAFQNNGGIRTSLIAAGDINYNQIFELQPFDNMIATAQLNGSQVRDLLALWYSYNKEVPQVSGITVNYDPSVINLRNVTNAAGQTKPVSDPIKNLTDSQGNPILDTQNYTIVASDFLVTGGDGLDFLFGALKQAPVINQQRKQRDVLVDYLKLESAGLDYSKIPQRIINQSAQ